MKDDIFNQTSYADLDLTFSKYSCNFNSLCRVAQVEFKPIRRLKTRQDVLAFFEECSIKGFVRKADCLVLKACEILEALTGIKFKQLNAPSGLGYKGTPEWQFISNPVPANAIEILVWRKVANPDITHFFRGKTIDGNTCTAKMIHNPLGADWCEKNKDTWCPSDKRVYVPVKAS